MSLVTSWRRGKGKKTEIMECTGRALRHITMSWQIKIWLRPFVWHSFITYSIAFHSPLNSVFFSPFSTPPFSKQGAAEFTICSGNGVFWLMNWPFGQILPGHHQLLGACLRMHACHWVCISVCVNIIWYSSPWGSVFCRLLYKVNYS